MTFLTIFIIYHIHLSDHVQPTTSTCTKINTATNSDPSYILLPDHVFDLLGELPGHLVLHLVHLPVHHQPSPSTIWQPHWSSIHQQNGNLKVWRPTNQPIYSPVGTKPACRGSVIDHHYIILKVWVSTFQSLVHLNAQIQNLERIKYAHSEYNTETPRSDYVIYWRPLIVVPSNGIAVHTCTGRLSHISGCHCQSISNGQLFTPQKQ